MPAGGDALDGQGKGGENQGGQGDSDGGDGRGVVEPARPVFLGGLYPHGSFQCLFLDLLAERVQVGDDVIEQAGGAVRGMQVFEDAVGVAVPGDVVPPEHVPEFGDLVDEAPVLL